MRNPFLLALAPLLLGAAPLPAPPRLLPVKDVMRHIVNPAAELYWKSAGEVDDAAGEHHRVPTPQDDARWAATLDAAMALQESGNLLMMQGRARDDGPWMTLSQQLVDAGVTAVSAAAAKDEKKTFDAGSALYEACFACHAKYIPRPAKQPVQAADARRRLQAPDVRQEEGAPASRALTRLVRSERALGQPNKGPGL